MLVFTIKKNSQHPGTGDIESTFVKIEVDVPYVEAELLRKWNGMSDSYVVECRIRKETAESCQLPTTKQGSVPSEITPVNTSENSECPFCGVIWRDEKIIGSAA